MSLDQRPSSHGPDDDDVAATTVAQSRPLISTLGWEVESIVASSPNFHHVKRVHYTSPNAKVDLTIPEVESNGNPLIIAGWNRHPRWPKSLFNLEWLKQNGDQNPSVRNVHNWADFKITMNEFIKKLRETPAYTSADEQERLYGKDGECPPEWAEWLTSGAIPDSLLFDGSNDFLKFLPDKAKVQTLMCYMGIGDTFTPFHKDLCASSGQNLLCFSEHSGSAFWFMTKSSAAPHVAAYFHKLGQEVDLETHVVTIEELAKAPFDVYIAEQQLGDLVLVPPRSCHQVVNKGGITIKTSWSRMSLNGLQTALWHELPIYHRVCRQEIYKVKSNIFHALQHFTGLAEGSPERHEGESPPTFTEHLKQLVFLFDDILAAEISVYRDSMPHVSQSDTSHTDNLHCDFCGADIFQSFFECDSCLPTSTSEASAGVLLIGDGLVLCPSCYVEGRTCQCGNMQPVQCRPFSELLKTRDRAIRAIERIDNDYVNGRGYLSEQPNRLLSERDANIFEAACKLSQKRQADAKAMKSCRVRLMHQVPAPAAIYCKTCHFSECYTHLLELNSVHSVDAMMLSDAPDGDTDWHHYHRDSSQQYEEIRQRAIEDEENGSRPNASHRLVYLAKTFSTCRAMALEVTRHGWYDRFIQTISIPIANAPPKALVRLPDGIDGDELCASHVSDDSHINNWTTPTSKDVDPQMAHFRRESTPPLPASSTSGGINEVGLLPHFSLSVVTDPSSSVVGPMSPSSKSGTLQVLGSPTDTSVQHDVPSPLSAPSSPLIIRYPPAATSFSVTDLDDGENLSDLTDLPTEVGSPHNSIVTIPVSETSEQHVSMEFLPSSLLSAEGTSSDTRPMIVSVSKLKPRLVLDCVEISASGWYGGKREKSQTSSRKKRRRLSGPFLSDIVDSDNSPSAALATSSRSLSKRKKKMSKGPASRRVERLPPSSKHTHSSLDVRNHPPPDNILANALNQTFRLNSTTAAHAPTTPLFTDTIPPVSNAVVSTTVKPQYRDFGIQKNLNFTRHTPTVEPSGDLSNCILRLEAENRNLQAQAEKCKLDCEMYRESLDELNKRYNSSGYHHSTPPSGSSHFIPQPPPELSCHPRWRTRNLTTGNRPQSTNVEEPDFPPIETLPVFTPSSPESISPTRRRRTPTGPRALTIQVHPYIVQPHRRKRGPSDFTNGRRPRGKVQGPPTLDCGDSVNGGPTPPNVVASGEAGASGTSTTIDCDHDKVPTSPPSIVSDRVQLPKSPVEP